MRPEIAKRVAEDMRAHFYALGDARCAAWRSAISLLRAGYGALAAQRLGVDVPHLQRAAAMAEREGWLQPGAGKP